MRTKTIWMRAKLGFVALACAAMPLALTASCDPSFGTLDIVRYDDDHSHMGWFGELFDGCMFDDCYYEEEIIFFP